MAGLCHPCVVGAYEYGIADGNPYYTMELLEGPTLRDLVGAPVDQCCRMLRGVASALAFLHSRRLLHRDLKARNVRCDAQGQPKLLDFGVLATMGVAGDVAGTPPGIPPEALRGLPLDARADLFGLGTLAYRLLTGRQAFPAESVSVLEEHWRRRPERPSARRPEVPEALDELVMELLSIEPVGRPSSAAEVIARLDAIGGLEQAPELEVAQGWLQSARLVGRGAELRRIRDVVEGSTHGNGSMLVLEGPSGVGKTRLLREAGLHAQLAGATVLRGRGRLGYAPYDLVRQLVGDMMRTCPDDVLETGRDRRAAVARVLPELALDTGRTGAEPGNDVEPPAEERLRIQAELLEWFLAVAKRRALVLVIDDLERCDDGSAALLAALSHRAHEHSVSILGGWRTGLDAAPPRAVLQGAGEHIRLGELERGAVAELVAEWFGDMPGASGLVDWMHRVAGGSPLHCSELARHLSEQGVVLYAEGMWRLMADPSEIELPEGMADTMDLRISVLSPMGRALGQALALWRGAAPVELCTELFDPEGLSAVFEALDELVYEEIIVGGDGGFDLSHDGVRDALLRSLEDEERREIHLRTSALIRRRWGPQGGERDADLGWHLLRGGQRREGAAQLEKAGRERFAAHSFEDAIGPLEAAVEVYRADALPGDELRSLELCALLVRAGVIASRAVVLRHAEDVLDGYARRGGLPLARRLSGWLGPSFALLLAVFVAWLRWRWSGREGPSPKSALVVTATVANYVASIHAMSFDVGQVEAVDAAVAPLRAVRNPAGRASAAMLDAFTSLASGRWDRARAQLDAVLEATDELEQGIVLEVDRRMFIGGARALRVVTLAVEQVPEFLDALEDLRALDMRFFALGAQMSRIYRHRLRGEEPQARELLRETNLSVVQLGNAWIYETVQAWVSALAYGLTGDVVALRRVADELERLDRAQMGVQSFRVVARAELLRAQGDLDAAKEQLEAELGRLHPEQGVLRRLTLRAVLLDVLLDDERPESAVELAELTLTEAPLGMGPRPARIRARCAHAIALADIGRIEEALSAIDALGEDSEGLDSPLLLGVIEETGARVAEIRGDELSRMQYATRAELLFSSTGNPVLVARARRLMGRMHSEPVSIDPLPDSEVSQVSEVLDTVDLDTGAAASLSMPDHSGSISLR